MLASGAVNPETAMPPAKAVEPETPAAERRDFIREIVAADLSQPAASSRPVTRFPPEPNGYLHIGHAKSICLNFGIAQEFGGRCNLRFDDTNPVKEEQEYLDAIERDVRWLGFDWGDNLFHASDYFEQLYAWAVHLIERGLAFVDDQSADEIRETRGTLTSPGTDSPWRDRSVEENLDLFARMRAGEFPNGARVLRAKIDMASPNINLRDPVLYRIVHASHPRTGDAWCIYPTYDFAHGQSDAIEGVTHSICTLEFEVHRPLYDWLIEHLPVPHVPHQYEFARLNLTHTVLSKRVLLRLVSEGHVRGWDDPRMPTISGLRRRGFPAEGIRDFAAMIGVAKTDSVIEVGQLEYAVRCVLNRTASAPVRRARPRQGRDHELAGGPGRARSTSSTIPRTRRPGRDRSRSGGSCGSSATTSWRSPPPKFFRLAPGREVRLRNAYFITCEEVVKDAAGRVVELRCTYDPATRGGDAPDGRRPKATLHWVSAGSRGPGRGPPVRPPLQPARPGRRGRPLRGPQPGVGDDRSRGACSSRRSRRRRSARPSSSSGWATSRPTRTRDPGALVFNRTLTLKDTLGEGRRRKV